MLYYAFPKKRFQRILGAQGNRLLSVFEVFFHMGPVYRPPSRLVGHILLHDNV